MRSPAVGSLLLALTITALTGACGRAERADRPAANGSPPAKPANPPAGGGVPDACVAIAPADVVSTLGAIEPGTPGGSGSRTVCRYADGTIVGVSEANQYEPSVTLARQGGECNDLTGVGDRAVFCVVGGAVGQLMWLDGDLMYDVTAGQTDQAPFAALAAKVR